MIISFSIVAILTIMLIAFVVPFLVSWWQKRKVDPFEISIIFTINYFLGFWLKPLMAIVDPEKYSAPWYQRASYSESAIISGLFLALLGIIAFYIGYYYLRWGEKLSRYLPIPSWPWKAGRVWLVLAVSCLISFETFLYFLERGQYSLAYLVLNRGEVVSGVGLIGWLFTFSTILGFLVFMVFRMQPRTNRAVRTLSVLFAVAIALGVLSIFGSRGNLLLVIGSALMVRHYCVKRFSLTQAALVGIGVVLFSAAVLVLRGWTVVGETAPFDHAYEAVIADLISVSTGWEGFLMVVEGYPDQYPYYHGTIIAGDFLWLIPRLLWGGKPAEYGGFLVQRDLLPGLISEKTGLGTYESFSPLGYGYADFGILGAVIAMLAHGIFWRAIYEYLKRNEGAPPAAAVYGLLVLSLSTYARGFVGSFLAVLVFWLPIVYVMRWLGAGPRSSQPIG